MVRNSWDYLIVCYTLVRKVSQDLTTQMRGVLCLLKSLAKNYTQTFSVLGLLTIFVFGHATVGRTILSMSWWELQGWGSNSSINNHSFSIASPSFPFVYTSSSLHNLIILNPSSMTSSNPSHSSSSAALHRLLLASLAWEDGNRSEEHVASGHVTCLYKWVVCWPVCNPLCFE